MNLDNFMEALQAASTAKRRDDCGDMCIGGKAGRIYRLPEGFYLFCDPGSARAWSAVKKALEFCMMAQDGEVDGFLFLGRLPTTKEAELIRDKLVIRKRVILSEDRRAALIAAGAKHAFQPRRRQSRG